MRLVLVHNISLINRYYKVWMMLGIYSLSGRTPYRQISWSLEAARFWFRLFAIALNLTGCCRDVCRISERYDHHNIQSRRFEHNPRNVQKFSSLLRFVRVTALVPGANTFIAPVPMKQPKNMGYTSCAIISTQILFQVAFTTTNISLELSIRSECNKFIHCALQ